MDENKNMSRREFLRRMGVGAGSAMAIMALEPLNVIAKEKPEKPADNRMTYRVQHGSGEQNDASAKQPRRGEPFGGLCH